jgi:hypothetical protein
LENEIAALRFRGYEREWGAIYYQAIVAGKLHEKISLFTCYIYYKGTYEGLSIESAKDAG